jgi:hypothetical protein
MEAAGAGEDTQAVPMSRIRGRRSLETPLQTTEAVMFIHPQILVDLIELHQRHLREEARRAAGRPTKRSRRRRS